MKAASEQKRNQELTWSDVEGDPLGILRETEISQYWRMLYAQIIMFLKMKHKILPDLGIKTDQPLLIDKKKRPCHQVDFTHPIDPRVKRRVSGKMDKFLNSDTDLKILWNLKVTVLLIGVGSFRTASSNPEKKTAKIEVQTIALLNSDEILRRVQEFL